MTNYRLLQVILLLGTALLVTWGSLRAEETGEPASLLIRNATLVDPAGKVADRVVSMLIRAGRLEIITEDPVPAVEAREAFDAEEGFVIGNLEVGAPPNFMILSADPREDFKVLLDTKSFASFAMHDGEVVKNRLPRMVEPGPEETPRRAGWLAYTPPPLMVPLNYRDTSKWNRFETKYVSGIFAAGLFLDRMSWLSQDDTSKAQVGDVSDFEGGEIRGLRFGLVGTLNVFEQPWVYTIFGATNAFDKGFNEEGLDDVSLFDWRVDVPFLKSSVLSIGKQKEPISGERVQSMLFNQMQERSAVADALMPSRNVGIVWNGGSPERYMTWGIGVFNDWFDASQDFNESATQYVGRLTWAPLRNADDSSVVHLGFGYRHSDAKEGFRFRTEPEFNNSPTFVDTGFGSETGVLPAERLDTYNLELAWRWGPLWLASEYTRADVDNPGLGNPSFDGYWVGASWALTGEMRSYNRKSGTFGGLPVSRSVYQGGKGTWEANARWSSIDLSDGAVQGGEMDIASLGLNWWLTPFFGVNANYRYIWHSRSGLDATASGFNTRIILLLE